MGVAAYNRGTAVVRRQIQADCAEGVKAADRRMERDIIRELQLKLDTEQAEQSENGIIITVRNGWTCVTFAEKPERSVLNELKEAGYRWRNGSWQGDADKLPESVKANA